VNSAPELLLVGAVIAVGVHTIVPDHWVPITLIARQQGWSRRETARAALRAGTGHVLSTLLIGVVVWIAGAAFATRFGNAVSLASSLALIGFGGWIAIGSLREMRGGDGHGHSHDHGLGHAHGADGNAPHGPEKTAIATPHGEISLSIFEHGTPPRFRVTGPDFGTIVAETLREDGSRETFPLINLGPYWECEKPIREPHDFAVSLSVLSAGRTEIYETRFTEHDDHEHDRDENVARDALYSPLRGGTVTTTHVHRHRHRHGNAAVHAHRHDHDGATWHLVDENVDAAPPTHEHRHKTSSRTALLLILGSSPMVEGIPAFFAAGKYGPGLIAVMSGGVRSFHDHDIRRALRLLDGWTAARQTWVVREIR